MPEDIKELIIAIKGAGEMATGVAWRLFRSNFKNIFMLEIKNPLAVRRQVSFCEAIYDEKINVEGVEAIKAYQPDEIQNAWDIGCIPVTVDPDWKFIRAIQPHVVVDAIMAKKNLGTSMSEAPLVIALGPGFEAGKDAHMVIETQRGHTLGSIILNGSAEPDTGKPGSINGYTEERILRSPCSGIFNSTLNIGAVVKQGDVMGHVNGKPVVAKIDGILRGLIKNNMMVSAQFKIGDIDPRENKNYCNTISEKARAIGGGVLEAILRKYNQ
jgi:xanthine dehydrogenase accessory factor